MLSVAAGGHHAEEDKKSASPFKSGGRPVAGSSSRIDCWFDEARHELESLRYRFQATAHLLEMVCAAADAPASFTACAAAIADSPEKKRTTRTAVQGALRTSQSIQVA